jgi:hypothetical protein
MLHELKLKNYINYIKSIKLNRGQQMSHQMSNSTLQTKMYINIGHQW